MNQVYLGRSAFWIVHHDAIDSVYDLALGFWHKAKEAGALVSVSVALGYAMQILCASPEGHLTRNHADVWVSDDEGRFRHELPNDGPWIWRPAFAVEELEIRPSIIHLPNSKEILAGSPQNS